MIVAFVIMYIFCLALFICVIFLSSFRENSLTGIIDTNFAVEHNSFGVLKVHELKPGGRDISVTEENKKEYVK